ncbi:MAG: helix-turn-helix transcriptional regulator, partial [Clostridia bacterium]|nr:helix-turn-helix transcriptional regulator [Clostridia bacterium]
MYFPSGLNISRMSVHDFEFKKSESVFVPGRIHHALTFRLEGKVSVSECGSSKKLISEKNCITYVPKGCSYDTEVMESGRMFVIHFETENSCKDVSSFVYKPTYPIAFENMFRSLYERYRSTGGHDYAVLSMAYEIFANLRHELTGGEYKAVPKRMRLVKEYIDENYGNRDLTISDLAKSIMISEVYFRREFKACFGVSPLEYINKVRLEHAKALLSTA